MKTIRIIFLTLSILIIVGFVISKLAFSPIPVIDNTAENEISRIEFNVEYGTDGHGKMIEVEEFDEEEVLTYLSTCKERRTLKRTNGYIYIKT